MKHFTTSNYRALILIICLINVNSIFSQLSDWQNYTNGDWVFSIMNDGEYLWIGTDGGAVKINKTTEEKYYYNRANAELPDNHILSLAKDKNNNIWLGSKYSGIACFDGRKSKIFNENNSNIKSEQYCSAIAIDADNNKWIGTLFYLNKFNDKEWQSWTTPNSDIISSIWTIYSMKFDKDGVLWMGGTGGWSFAKFADNKMQVLLKENDVYGIAIDKSNDKWLATNDGLVKFDGESFTKFNKDNSELPCNKLVGISKDNEENLWLIGEEGYLIKCDNGRFITYKIPFKREKDRATCIEIDDDNVWIGTRYEGMYKFKDGIFSQIDLSNSPLLTNDISFCADLDENNNVWLGTDYNLVKIDDHNNWSSHYEKMKVMGEKRIKGTNYSKGGDLWVSFGGSDTCVLKISKDETVVSFTKQNTPLFGQIPQLSETFSSFAFDKKGNTWLASRIGLFKYDGRKWDYFSPDNSPLPNYQINSLAIDKGDNLWIGSGDSFGGGLCKYDGTDWTVYTTKNSGLPTPFVVTMQFDSQNILWLSCRDTTNFGKIGKNVGGGLTRFDGKSWQSFNIKNSKIPSNTIMDIAIDKNDHIWLATYGHAGITKYDGTNWESYSQENSGIAWDEVSKITLDYGRDLIWLNHLDNSGISTAKLNWDGSGIANHEYGSALSFGIYPNPAKDVINLQFPDGIRPERLDVYTVSGSLIYSGKPESMICDLTDLSIHEKGLYLLKVTDSSNRLHTGRLLVE